LFYQKICNLFALELVICLWAEYVVIIFEASHDCSQQIMLKFFKKLFSFDADKFRQILEKKKVPQTIINNL
jgi:replication initiation and membrane attachment protein DnaB